GFKQRADQIGKISDAELIAIIIASTALRRRWPSMPDPKTLFDKVWDAHVVRPETADTPGVLYIDLHLVHEVTSPQAFSEIEARGLKVRRPDRTYATLDHSTPTLPAGLNGLKPYVTPQ
ncbi:large subunit, partial [Streptomyces coelicoflavus ZG0656]